MWLCLLQIKGEVRVGGSQYHEAQETIIFNDCTLLYISADKQSLISGALTPSVQSQGGVGGWCEGWNVSITNVWSVLVLMEEETGVFWRRHIDAVLLWPSLINSVSEQWSDTKLTPPVKSLHARLCPFYFLAVNQVNCVSKVQQLPKLSDQHFKSNTRWCVHAFVWKCSLFPILFFFLIILIRETKFGKHFTIRLNLLTLMY